MRRKTRMLFKSMLKKTRAQMSDTHNALNVN